MRVQPDISAGVFASNRKGTGDRRMSGVTMGLAAAALWRRLVGCVLLAAALAACSHGAQPESQVSAMWRDLEIEVVGTLVGSGRCGVIVDQDGRRYGVVGDLSRYQRGARLRVSGVVSYWSGCNTYSAIKAGKIESVSPPPQSVHE